MSIETPTPFVGRELASLLLNARVSSGMSRTVYESPLLPGYVIKVEDEVERFQNVIEWETWNAVRETPFAVHYAPCEHISACGGVLVMRKTEPVTMEQLPPRMPAFLCDFKRTNYGLLDGRLVCHDYGLLFPVGLNKRTRAVNWHDY